MVRWVSQFDYGLAMVDRSRIKRFGRRFQETSGHSGGKWPNSIAAVHWGSLSGKFHFALQRSLRESGLFHADGHLKTAEIGRQLHGVVTHAKAHKVRNTMWPLSNNKWFYSLRFAVYGSRCSAHARFGYHAYLSARPHLVPGVPRSARSLPRGPDRFLPRTF